MSRSFNEKDNRVEIVKKRRISGDGSMTLRDVFTAQGQGSTSHATTVLAITTCFIFSWKRVYFSFETKQHRTFSSTVDKANIDVK